jgi:hypothetical protein
MLSQNLATILAALVGGLMAIIAGIVVNIFMLLREGAKEKRKEIRDTLVKIYDATARINTLYRRATEDQPNLSAIILEIPQQLAIIGTHVTLFMPNLENKYRPYNESMTQIIGLLQKLRAKEINERQYIEEASKHVSTQQDFRDALAEFSKKEGYSYL